MNTNNANEQIIQDAHEAAEAAVDQGFFAHMTITSDVVAAIRSLIYQDSEPFVFDVEEIDENDMDEWVEAHRARLFELGCKELGVDAD
jgi:hypothetical protein